MKNHYNKTITACFVGYIVQAIVNNFTPLLFLFFQRSYHIPLSQITLLVTFNFGIQLLVDLLSVGFVDKIGYRASMIMAHVLSAAGLVLLTVLPEILPAPFVGIFNCRHDLRRWRRSSGSAGQPGHGILPFRQQGESHEHAAFLLLLGTCGRGSDLHFIFLSGRN